MKKLFSAILILAVLILIIFFCLNTYGRTEEARKADRQIADIGEITLSSAEQIISAEETVAALSEEEQKTLHNIKKLQKIRETYDEILKIDIEELEKSISAIGEITLDSRAMLANIKNRYDKIPEVYRDRVTNYAIWEAANEQYEALKAAEEERMKQEAEERKRAAEAKKAEVKRLLNSFRVTTDDVENVTFYHSTAQPYYANSRSYVLPYIGQRDNYYWLRLECLYTGDDWIFFTKITFAVDDERYTKTYDYFSVTRDNSAGDVWEYVDFSPSESDIAMLWAIVNSEKTIVRFEGDDYHYDLTVSDKDKKAISDILTVYDGVKAGV